MKTCINQYFSISACWIYINLDEIWSINIVGGKGKRRCDEQCVMINPHPFQLLRQWSHLGTNMSHDFNGRSIIIKPARPYTFYVADLSTISGMSIAQNYLFNHNTCFFFFTSLFSLNIPATVSWQCMLVSVTFPIFFPTWSNLYNSNNLLTFL